MTSKQTKAQQFSDYADAFKCIREGKPVKRSRAKDGSVPTHPVVEVLPLCESEVLKHCLRWLKQHNIFCDRHDSGAGDISGSGYATYGIKGAGDIVGLLPNGIHFEVECKAGKGGRLSVKQQKRMEGVRNNNGLYFVIHGIEELEHCFRNFI